MSKFLTYFLSYLIISKCLLVTWLCTESVGKIEIL